MFRDCSGVCAAVVCDWNSFRCCSCDIELFITGAQELNEFESISERRAGEIFSAWGKEGRICFCERAFKCRVGGGKRDVLYGKGGRDQFSKKRDI